MVLPLAAGAAAASGTVNVYYAASLKALNEDSVGLAFQAKTGYTYQGFPNNSGIIVNELKAHLISPDVVEFADAGLNAQLMGSANGKIVKWYITFARTHLVIGFNPNGKYAPLFRRVQQGKLPWYEPLLARGIKFGRTDPNSDPKGQRVIFAFNLAQKLYHLKDFTRRALGPIANPDPRGVNSTSPQVFPEATLVSQLASGNLDAGVFYLPEARAAKIPFIGLPQPISFGSPKYAKLDATQHYTTSKGLRITGSPTYYTITIPSTVKNESGAVAFVKFALGNRAAHLGAKVGLQTIAHKIYGDKKAVPKGI
jgi:molybdate/tungstate transport system substrate-binding protein